MIVLITLTYTKISIFKQSQKSRVANGKENDCTMIVDHMTKTLDQKNMSFYRRSPSAFLVLKGYFMADCEISCTGMQHNCLWFHIYFHSQSSVVLNLLTKLLILLSHLLSFSSRKCKLTPLFYFIHGNVWPINELNWHNPNRSF